MESAMPMTIATTTPGSTMSRVAVGLAYSAFRDLGENATATCLTKDATCRRKTHVKKNKTWC
jgi:hypothetical protein